MKLPVRSKTSYVRGCSQQVSSALHVIPASGGLAPGRHAVQTLPQRQQRSVLAVFLGQALGRVAVEVLDVRVDAVLPQEVLEQPRLTLARARDKRHARDVVEPVDGWRGEGCWCAVWGGRAASGHVIPLLSHAPSLYSSSSATHLSGFSSSANSSGRMRGRSTQSASVIRLDSADSSSSSSSSKGLPVPSCCTVAWQRDEQAHLIALALRVKIVG